MMTNKDKYKQAFSVLHASEYISLEGCKMEKKKKMNYKQLAAVMGAFVICCAAILGWSYNVYAYTDVTVQVFMEEGIDDNQISAIQNELGKIDGVKDVTYISPEEAWSDFQNKYFTEDEASQFTENPLADSQNFQMKVQRGKELDKLQAEIEQIQGVRKVNVEESEK